MWTAAAEEQTRSLLCCRGSSKRPARVCAVLNHSPPTVGDLKLLRSATLLFPPLPSEAEAVEAQGSSPRSWTRPLPPSPWRDLQWPTCTRSQSFIFTTTFQELVLLITSFLPFGEEKRWITYGIPRSQKRDGSSFCCNWWENTQKHNPDRK